MLRAQNPTPVCARYEYVRESAVTRTRKAGEVTKPVEAARAGGASRLSCQARSRVAEHRRVVGPVVLPARAGMARSSRHCCRRARFAPRTHGADGRTPPTGYARLTDWAW
ncbi:hypothetical protein E6R61_15800 [Streptomyces sp. LRa12]|nr:hypothetical protein E6R61_15800 [Streptomyces sp. LRa12]